MAQAAAAEGADGFLERFRRRFKGMSGREKWGYGVWFGMGAVIAFPEVWAAAGDPPWPTISKTTGHLEEKWSVVAPIVVLLVVVPTAHVMRRAWSYRADIGEGLGAVAQPAVSLPTGSQSGEVKGDVSGRTEFVQADGQSLGATPGGRFTKKPESHNDEVAARYYFPSAALLVALLLIASHVWTDNEWASAYIIYGAIATFWVVVPSALAYWVSKDVPFPTLFQTVADLERRLHFIALLLLGLLVVLLLHLAFYPWPDIFRAAAD